MLLRHLFNEGGWATAVTQSTKLTPQNVKRALALLPRLQRDFNVFLDKLNLPPVIIEKPVGSTTYAHVDAEDNPTKEYGDVDVLMEVPRIDGMTEARITTTYKSALSEFSRVAKLPYLYNRDMKASNVIVKIGEDEYVQVDMVMAFQDVADWAKSITTPERGLKGAITGFIYSSLAEVLHVSVSQPGVRAKKKAGQVVSFADRGGDEVIHVSKDFSNFGRHIAEWVIHELNPSHGRIRLHSYLEEQPGPNPTNVRLVDIVKMAKGIVLTIASNGALGKGFLSKYETADALMDEVRRVYRGKLTDGANDAKLDKAETPEAKQRAAALRELFLTKAVEVSKALEL